MSISRRDFIKGSLLAVGPLAAGFVSNISQAASELPKVYFSKELTAESLLRLYGMISHNLTGKIASSCIQASLTVPTFCPVNGLNLFLQKFPALLLWNAMFYIPVRARQQKDTAKLWN